MAGTVGVQFSIQAKYSDQRGRDVIARMALAGFSLVVIFHPNTFLATLAIAPVGALIGYWLRQQRKSVP